MYEIVLYAPTRNSLLNTDQHASFKLKGWKLDRQVLNTRQVMPTRADLDFYKTQRKL
jgi:hypothetical protein